MTIIDSTSPLSPNIMCQPFCIIFFCIISAILCIISIYLVSYDTSVCILKFFPVGLYFHLCHQRSPQSKYTPTMSTLKICSVSELPSVLTTLLYSSLSPPHYPLLIIMDKAISLEII